MRTLGVALALVISAFGPAACAEMPLGAQPPLAPAATRADVALLDRALVALHPGLTRYQTREQWAARVAELDEWLREPRSRGDVYLALARLTASLRCGHTYLNFWNQPAEVKSWLFEGKDKLPFTFRLDGEDRFVVHRSAVFDPADPSRLLLEPGQVVTAIQGVDTGAIVERMLPLVRADGGNDGKRRALIEIRGEKEYETSDALLPLVVAPDEQGWALVVRGADAAAPRTLQVPAVSAARRTKTALPLPAPRPMWSLARDGDLAILTVDGFVDEDRATGTSWRKFLESAFRELKRDEVRGLIVDLRANEGGSDAAAMLLVQHLIRERLEIPALRAFVSYQTVPDSLRPYLSTWDDRFYDRRRTTSPRGDGTYDLRKGSATTRSLAPASSRFAGSVCVLTSPVNSSATHTVARLLSALPHVTLVGEPTGGSRRASTGGNLFFLRLPQTGFEVDVPLIAYEWDGEADGPVRPRVECPEEDALARAKSELRR